VPPDATTTLLRMVPSTARMLPLWTVRWWAVPPADTISMPEAPTVALAAEPSTLRAAAGNDVIERGAAGGNPLRRRNALLVWPDDTAEVWPLLTTAENASTVTSTPPLRSLLNTGLGRRGIRR
jgi:hypothetical protein